MSLTRRQSLLLLNQTRFQVRVHILCCALDDVNSGRAVVTSSWPVPQVIVSFDGGNRGKSAWGREGLKRIGYPVRSLHSTDRKVTNEHYIGLGGREVFLQSIRL